MKICFTSILSILSGSLMMLSCNSILDTKPKDFLTTDQYFKTEADLNAALSGVYSSLAQDGTYGRNIPIELEMGNDEAHYNNRNNNNTVPSLYDCQSSTKIYSDCWTALYQGIGRANLLLSNIDASPAASSIKDPIKGEALFLRAFNYFQLVTRYGDVPLILLPTKDANNLNYPRTPSIDVYNKIVEDMKTAEGLVKEATTVNSGSRVTKTVVQGILARVYLKMGGRPLMLGVPAFDSARTYALKVINSGLHKLNPSYEQVFINHSMDAYDNTYRESMWEIEFYGNNTPQGAVPPGSRFASQLAMRYTGSDPNAVYGYGSYVPSGVLYNMYTSYSSTTDTLRRNWNMPEFTYNFGGVSSTNPREVTPYATGTYTFERDCGKWKRDYEVFSPKQRDWGPTNFPVIRYADVLLMAAEAENEVNGPNDIAIGYINQVRQRAKTLDLFAFRVSTQEAMRKFIQDERARELCFEALRKFDLIRWGIFIAKMDFTKSAIANSSATATNKNRFLGGYFNVKLRDTLLPIPSSELSVNSLITQNPGW